MSTQDLTIAGTTIAPGEDKNILATISKLPTRTPIEIPIIVSRSAEPGPTVLFMGGMHGDEINGTEIVRRLISNKYYKPKIGTVICIPILNVYGFIHFSRQVPDGKDVNRSFPGSRTGSLASMIAYHLRDQILPIIDMGIDFHTGGARINNFPQLRGHLETGKNLELAKVFGTKFIIDSPYRDKSFRKEASKIGKSILVFEGGESLRLRKNAIDEGVSGALRIMKYLGMRESAPEAKYQPIIVRESRWLRATAAGIHHSIIRPGDRVEKGQKTGLITGPFGDFEKVVKSSASGHVLAVNNIPVVNRGDALIHIGLE